MDIFRTKIALLDNYRWAMMCKNAERLSESKKNTHLQSAEQY